MKKSYQALQVKRRFIAGKLIVGIDPGKFSHQAVVQDADGLTLGKSFSFAQSYAGYHQSLPKKLARIIPTATDRAMVFAVERSCNLWQTLCAHLHGQGHPVVLVSPLSTHQARAMTPMNQGRLR